MAIVTPAMLNKDDSAQAMSAVVLGRLNSNLREKLKEQLAAEAEKRRIAGESRAIGQNNAQNQQIASQNVQINAKNQAEIARYTQIKTNVARDLDRYKDSLDKEARENAAAIIADADANLKRLNSEFVAYAPPVGTFPGADVETNVKNRKKTAAKTMQASGRSATILSQG